MGDQQTWREVRARIRADGLRYVHYETGAESLGLRSFVGALLRNPGLQATAVHRVERQLYALDRPGPLLRVCRVGVLALRKVVDVVTGIWIARDARLDGGVYIAHSGGVVIGPAVIGPNCNLGHGVTIGINEGADPGCPTLGARVQMGPGAVALGAIQIGDDAVIGANSVVTRSVPPRGVAIGVPATVRSGRGSFGLVRYAGADRDPDRAASLRLAGDGSGEDAGAGSGL
jgi:serine O-acetyltransferase